MINYKRIAQFLICKQAQARMRHDLPRVQAIAAKLHRLHLAMTNS